MAGSGRDDGHAEPADRRGAAATPLSAGEKQMLILEDVAATLELEAMDDVITNAAGRGAGDTRDGKGTRTVGGRQIGMSVPSGAAPAAVPGAATRPTVAVNLQRAVAAVDARMVHLLTSARPAAGTARDCARVELAMLARRRRSLLRQLDALPTDVLLCESLIEYAENAQTAVGDLAGGAVTRVQRLLEFAREIVAELGAQGCDVAALKQQIAQARSLIGAGAESQPNDSAMASACDLACAVFSRAWAQLEERCPAPEAPSVAPSLLDDWIARG